MTYSVKLRIDATFPQVRTLNGAVSSKVGDGARLPFWRGRVASWSDGRTTDGSGRRGEFDSRRNETERTEMDRRMPLIQCWQLAGIQAVRALVHWWNCDDAGGRCTQSRSEKIDGAGAS